MGNWLSPPANPACLRQVRFDIRPFEHDRPADFEKRDQSARHPVVNAPDRLAQPLGDLILFDEPFSRFHFLHRRSDCPGRLVLVLHNFFI
jgi:hypothetical protein